MIANRILLLILLLWSLLVWGAQAASEPAFRSVTLELFSEAGCDSCAEVRRAVLPELERQYSGYYDLRERDIGIQSNYLALVHYQEVAQSKDNEPVSMVVDGRYYLAGLEQIKAHLFPVMDEALAHHLVETQEVERAPAARQSQDEGAGGVKRRVAQFTLLGVISAAAVDSLNPCAISALVFFMSLLSAARMGVTRMGMTGLAFLAACFLTYLAIGFGLIKVLGFLTTFRLLKAIIDWSLVGLLLGLAFFSFQDAVRYYRTRQAADVWLKLPDRLQGVIHRLMKKGLRSHHLIVGGFGVGVAVTLVESVCTGQVYVPALVMMLKSGQSIWRCTFYLLVYNTVFVLPLLVVLGLTCAGVKVPVLVAWSRLNVVMSKSLMGLLFLGMTVMMLLLR